MTTRDNESETNSRKIRKSSKFKCQYCNKRVVESSTCAKFPEIFHPSCSIKCPEQKSTICKHEAILPVMRGEHIHITLNSEIQINTMNTENKYLKQLLKEVQEKNNILQENCDLIRGKMRLLEKILNMETQANYINSQPRHGILKDGKQNKSEHERKGSQEWSDVCAGERSVSNLTKVTEPSESKNGKELSEYQIILKRSWTTVIKKVILEKEIICTKSNRNSSKKVIGAQRKKWIYVGGIAGK
ncbi:hypothetical protein WA026_012627 [Henosepilachna vigintioctopunctata]|uniref:Uncharacterized protein n=1 Tax=Henosepilachna vigintioctopunctata TaxID=420089 RepID=A0AAW1TXL5_9CUCU